MAINPYLSIVCQLYLCPVSGPVFPVGLTEPHPTISALLVGVWIFSLMVRLDFCNDAHKLIAKFLHFDLQGGITSRRDDWVHEPSSPSESANISFHC